MVPFVLYCKSYRTDLKRVMRLAESIQQFNIDKLPFYVSVPNEDFSLFKKQLSGLNTEVLLDESIVQASTQIDSDQLSHMPGNLSQQVIKSEFWRLGLSDTYFCIDSDSIFIRPFVASDFISDTGTPYTVLDEGQHLLEDALRHKKERIFSDFKTEAKKFQEIFNRNGRAYSFGPFPLVWHRAVWESLDQQYLRPNRMSFADAIQTAPIESRWYGEALLKYKAIPLMPCQPFFKVYHYAWQLDQDRRSEIDLKKMAQIYSGVIYQSAWERSMDWPTEGGNTLSKVGRRIRRKLGRI
jgi:hypothetical protein